MQYLLIGFANALFYLLLLLLAEHIGFGAAYLASATASVLLISGYSRSVLSDTRRAGVMAAMLAGLYVFLYLVLQAEDYAMLAGAVGPGIILGSIMYLTRHVDWRPTARKIGDSDPIFEIGSLSPYDLVTVIVVPAAKPAAAAITSSRPTRANRRSRVL